jgi:FtsH-binding integral membrane protein
MLLSRPCCCCCCRSPRVQTHLSKVYGTLALTLLATCFGVAADIRFHLGGLLSAIGAVMIIAILAFDVDKQNWQKRVPLLGVYGFLQGLSLGPLCNLAIQIDPAILLTAFLGTTIVFVCFGLSAIYSERRSYLWLGGVISSSMMFLAVLGLVSIFWRPMWIFSIQLYFGLAVFCAYVLFDTQMIIEKAEAGSDDFVGHALELFIDFVAIFTRILIILIKNAQEKENNSRKKSNRR